MNKWILLAFCVVFGCADGPQTPDTTDNSGSDLAWIDVHAHNDHVGHVDELVAAMDMVDLEVQIVMAYPKPTDTEQMLSATLAELDWYAGHRERFRFMYGGYDLQPLLHGSGRPASLPFDNDHMMQCGGQIGEQHYDQMRAVANDLAFWREEFEQWATEAAESGLFVGFGELAPLHFSLRTNQALEYYPADHEWLLWLSDLAADYDMVVQIHMEVVSGEFEVPCEEGGSYNFEAEDTLEELERLLEHNRETIILWSHAGWYNTGEPTAQTLNRMMAAHDNLYLDLKFREPQNDATKETYPFNSSGALKSEWADLLHTYANRIMIGTDVKYESGDDFERMLVAEHSALIPLMEALSTEDAEAIFRGTAASLFGI